MRQARVGHRTHQVMNTLRRKLPVNTAIFRGTTADIAGLAFVLRMGDITASANVRQRIGQQLPPPHTFYDAASAHRHGQR